MKDLVGQLKKLKYSQDAGWASSDVRKQSRTRLLEAIQNAESFDVADDVRGRFEYYRWITTQFISKPMVVGVAAFVLVLGGWMTSVDAASNSLPGDTLYTLKLVTEQARLRLASSEHRAVLHTEFAQRRYEEALAIRNAPGREGYFEQTINAFRAQMDLANSNLQKLQDEKNTETVQVATEVDQKIGELNAVIDEAAAKTEDQSDVEQVNSAREAAQQTQNAVVDAIVASHDGEEPTTSKTELDALFRKELAEVHSREAFDLGRLTVIQNTLDANEELLEGSSFDGAEDLDRIAFDIQKAVESDAEAMNMAAAGGYRSAFDILRDANDALLDIENRIAVMEINLMNELSAARNAAQQEEQAAEEQQPSESTIIQTSDSP